MKALWFCSIALPDLSSAAGVSPSYGGGWLHSLARELVKAGNVDLTICSAIPGLGAHDVVVRGIRYVNIARRKGWHLNERNPVRGILRRCWKFATDVHPDVIHVHGTEHFYGMVTADDSLDVPSVVSLQGLIGACAPFLNGGLGGRDLWKMESVRSILRGNHFLLQKWWWRRRSLLEKRILQGNRCFIGRTDWDREFLLATNPMATYYHCDEALRPTFYGPLWHSSKCKRHTLFCSSGSSPLKGAHQCIKAIAMLKSRYPDIQLHIANASGNRPSGYSKYLARLAYESGVSANVVLLGPLTEDEMVGEYLNANVFVLPSYIENSSNSLGEAMLLGVPCVVSNVGGIPSMMRDERTALAFSRGDSQALVAHIEQLFEDTALCTRLSTNARMVASTRHNPEAICSRTLDIYSRLGDTRK